jgi:hypothetical protein
MAIPAISKQHFLPLLNISEVVPSAILAQHEEYLKYATLSESRRDRTIESI